MRIEFLDKTKKKKFIEGIADFGIKKIPELLVRVGQERIRAYSGNLSKQEIMDLWQLFAIEGIGLYLGKEMIDKSGVREVRLSVDGVHVLQNQIKNNILRLDKVQEKLWFLGKNLELNEEQQELFRGKKIFVVVQSADAEDFLGTGKIGEDGKTLFGFLPKERRRKG